MDKFVFGGGALLMAYAMGGVVFDWPIAPFAIAIMLMALVCAINIFLD